MAQEANRTPIIVAAIGAFGVIGAALIANFDKIQVKSGSSISQAPGPSMHSSGSNSPNISAPNGEVRLNIDNSTKIGTGKADPLRFEGEVGQLDHSAGLLDFLNSNDGKVVYLDNRFDSLTVAANRVDENTQSITLWEKCDGLPAGQEPTYLHCTGTSILIRGADGSDSIFGYNQGFQYLKGYWSVRANPGMHQGLLSMTLTAVDVKDAR